MLNSICLHMFVLIENWRICTVESSLYFKIPEFMQQKQLPLGFFCLSVAFIEDTQVASVELKNWIVFFFPIESGLNCWISWSDLPTIHIILIVYQQMLSIARKKTLQAIWLWGCKPSILYLQIAIGWFFASIVCLSAFCDAW